MRVKSDILLLFTQAAMELSWLFAAGSFLMMSAAHRTFPLFEGSVVFLLAILLTRITRGRGLRVIWVLGLQVSGFLLGVSSMLYSFFSPHLFSYFNPEWILYIFNRLQGAADWLAFIILLVFAFVSWLSGVALARKTTDYALVCSRFDLGLTVLLCLFLVKFLFLVKGGIQLTAPTAEAMIYPFFIFGLIAVGLARNGETPFKGFISGYRGIGLLISFGGVALVLGTGLVLFFMPFLQAGAEMGYAVLKSGAEPLGRVFVSILRFLFAGAKMRSEPPATSSQEDGSGPVLPTEGGWESGIVLQILGWVLLVLGVIVGVFLLGLGLWYLFVWLSSRTSTQEGRPVVKAGLLKWFRGLHGLLLSFWRSVIRIFEVYKNGAQFFYFLIKWGRRSGMQRLVNETPCEYGQRLKDRFPLLGREISWIVDAFNLEAYREEPVDDGRMKVLKQARRRLLHVANWPSRLKSRFLR
ncbi:MAG: DUF4129 domain-containing protein [Desulfatiglandaceae bacterium]